MAGEVPLAAMMEAEEGREEDGGNILDDILNTKEEKFEDEEPNIKKEEEGEDLDLIDDDSVDGEAEERERKNLASDFTSSSDGEDGALLEEVKEDVKEKVDEEEEEEEGDEKGEGEEEEEEEEGGEKKKRKGKSYDYATKLNYLFREARFFLVKSNNGENVSLAKSQGVWSTPPQNESRFNEAFGESRNVLLLYSVKESGKFCGLARLATESRRDGPKVGWVLPPGLSAKALGGVFHIDWICHGDLSFQAVQHLYNPWNEGKPVKIGRDGQEIEPAVAEQLCRLFLEDPKVDMTPILRRSKEAARQLRAAGGARKAGPLGGHRGGLGGRGPPRHGPPGPERGRRRRYEEESAGRWSRGYEEPRPRPGPRDRSPPRHPGSGRGPAGQHYTDYLRSLAQPPPVAYYGYQPYPPHPRYYEGPPPPSYRSRDSGRSLERSRSYDRSVEEFLRRTADRPRERDRDRRPRR